jgi:polyisoprenoid-binding protein YceI
MFRRQRRPIVHRLTLVLLAALAAPALAQPTDIWEVDPAHSSIQFGVRHLMISTVRGSFPKFTARVVGDPKEPTRSVVEASIDAAAIDTGDPKRDDHLRTPDFFDVAKYPTITFKSTKVEAAGDRRFKLHGDLTMHGVTKPVVLDVEVTPEVKGMRGETRAGARATTKVNRKDFGINWSKTMDGGGLVVGDEVEVTIDVEGVKK